VCHLHERLKGLKKGYCLQGLVLLVIRKIISFLSEVISEGGLSVFE
jgi:hypothetical protein